MNFQPLPIKPLIEPAFIFMIDLPLLAVHYS